MPYGLVLIFEEGYDKVQQDGPKEHGRVIHNLDKACHHKVPPERRTERFEQ